MKCHRLFVRQLKLEEKTDKKKVSKRKKNISS